MMLDKARLVGFLRQYADNSYLVNVILDQVEEGVFDAVSDPEGYQ